MSDARIAAARVRARFTASWVASIDSVPWLARQFMNEDVPHLLGVLDQAGIGHQHTDTDVAVETLRMAELLPQLVHLARLANEATTNSPSPALWKARESDLAEGMAGLCPHRMRILLEAAVRALAETGWTGMPSGQPTAPWMAPEWREPER